METQIKLIKVKPSHYKFLYELLEQRDPIQNISHEELPLYEAHCEFNNRKPYKYDYVIDNGKWIGRVYITYQNEIGIQLLQECQGKGIGSAVIKYLKEKIGKPLYANISPNNIESQKFFERQGFKLIQYTYKY